MKNLKNRLSKKILLILASGLIVCGPKVQALPSQGTLDNSASATITTDMANNTMNIAGKGQNNIIDWASFNIDKGERVNFADKNNYLNLVHGVDMSRIYGTISGGNAVYLVNPNGILFADGAALDNVGGFVASTRNISSINKEAFLNDPTNTTAVLGVDNPVMDNKDYYPEDSKYVPKITMADLKLTNVPESATIILDGPGGVILKSKDLLDKVSHVVTRQIGGELGFGYEGGIADLSLTDAEKEKISLVNGDKYYGKDSAISYPVRSYKWIRNWDELKAYSDINVNKMLVNDINLDFNINPCESFFGDLEGLGYAINNIKIHQDIYDGGIGIFKQSYGHNKISNLTINNVNINANIHNGTIGGLMGYSSSSDTILNNVNINGDIKAEYVGDKSYSTYSYTIGGIIGSALGSTEIRNSSSNVNILAIAQTGNNIGGIIGSGSLPSAGHYGDMMFNITNNGNITFVQKGINYYTWGNSWKNFIGGIIGNSGYSANKDKHFFVGCINNGDIRVSVKPEYIADYSGEYYIGGINTVYNPNSIKFGECYNLGKIILDYPVNLPNKVYVGAIVTERAKYNEGIEVLSSVTGKKLLSYYVENNIPKDENVSVNIFGEAKRADELLLDYNLHDMIGVHDFSVKHTWPPIPPSGGNTGGGATNPPSGGNTGSGTTNPPSGGNTGGGTTNPPSGEPTNHPSEDDEFKYTFGMFIDDMKKGTEYWKNKYKEWKAEKEARKAEEKLQNELNKAIEEIDKMANDKKVDKAEISDNVKKGIDNSVIDKEIDKEEVKEKIAELFADAVALSIEKSGTTGFKPKDLWKRIHSSSDDVYVIVDGKKYIIKGSFTGESGALMGDFNVTVDKKNYNVTTFYTATNSAETFMNAASAYGKEVCYNILTKISKDVTIMTKALAEPKVALTLWKECGGKDLVDNTVANQIKAQNNIKGILATVIPEAGDLIATIIDSPN